MNAHGNSDGCGATIDRPLSEDQKAKLLRFVADSLGVAFLKDLTTEGFAINLNFP
jgi:hypothetical protein